MAFTATDRVRVTNQTSQCRNKSGTVETAAADDAGGLVRVRIDGFPVGQVKGFAEGDLASTTIPTSITY